MHGVIPKQKIKIYFLGRNEKFSYKKSFTIPTYGKNYDFHVVFPKKEANNNNFL